MHISSSATGNVARLYELATPVQRTESQLNKTADTFKTRLRSQGKTIRQWAEENGFPPLAVYRVLNGVEKAHFGRAHDIAIAAGIKARDTDHIAA